MTRYAYCNVCKKEVEQPVRKPLETFQKVLWIILIIGTIGIAAIIYAFYSVNRKKDYCPTCYASLQFSNEPFEKEKEEELPLTPKEKALKKAEKIVESKKKKEMIPVKEEEEIKAEQRFCPYCGENIKLGLSKCPYCHTVLKTP